MPKSLLQRILDQYNKLGLTFIQDKETYTKYIGVLKDNATGYEMKHEIPKCVAVERVKHFAASERDMMDMYIKIQGMKRK